MLLTDLLTRNAADYGDEISLIELNPSIEDRTHLKWKEYALVEGGCSTHIRRELTWQEFDDAANRVANMLRAKGVRKGEKVAILLMNCLEWLPIYFGVLRSGATVVPLNFRYTSEEITYCLDLADASILIFGIEFIDRINPIINELKKIEQYIFVGDEVPEYASNYEEEVIKFSSVKPDVEIREEDDAAIYYSSGTTGFPKAILHTQSSLYSAVETEYAHHQQKKEDIFILIPPLYHTGAKMHWFGSLMSGGRTIILKGTDPKWILETAAAEKATIVWLLVPWAQDILEVIESGDVDLTSLDLSSWRLMHIGAQPVPPSLIHRWKNYFPHHQYDTNYGLSESIGPGAVHLGIENMHKVGAIGKAGYRWETRIVSEIGEDVATGSVGELIVKGPGVMKEYYKDPDATAASLKDGWLYTGDMARQDADGFIYLVDRKKDVIISGGENIYPVQIEDFLHKHKKIKDVAVIGIADTRLGEVAAAVIEVKNGETLSEEEVFAFAEELPRYKRPRRIIFDTVSRNATGKIEKPKMRKKYNVDMIIAQEMESGK